VILLEGFSKEKNAPIGTNVCSWLLLNSSSPTDTPFDFHKRLNVGAPYCSWFMRSDIFPLSNSCKKTWNHFSSSTGPNCWELAGRNRLFVCLFVGASKDLIDPNCWDLPVRTWFFLLELQDFIWCKLLGSSCKIWGDLQPKLQGSWNLQTLDMEFHHHWG
jgi:hypothetical protein